MGNFIKSYSRLFFLVILILFTSSGYYIYSKYFYLGSRQSVLKKKLENLKRHPNKFIVMDDIKKIMEQAKIADDRRLFIESSIFYYERKASFGFKQESYDAFFELLENEGNILENHQLFSIIINLISPYNEPYYFRDKTEVELNNSIIDELKTIINDEENNNTRCYYLLRLYELNIIRDAKDLQNLENDILKYSPNKSAGKKLIYYRKALKFRAQKNYKEEFHYMNLASVGGEPGVGEMGVTLRNNNFLESAELSFLKLYEPNNTFDMDHYFFPCINLAKVYIKKKEYNHAKIFIEKTEQFAKRYLGEFYISEILELKSNLLIKQNLRDVAIQAMEAEKDHILNQFSNFYLKNKNKALIINEVRLIRKNRNLVIVVLSFLGILSAVLFISYIIKLLKHNKSIMFKMKSNEKKLTELESELSNAFITFSELSYISDKKDKVIDAIMSNKEIKKALNQNEIRLLNELKSFTNTGNEWSLVKSNFNVHFPEFYAKLVKLNPNLTELELRYATYIKMGLSNTEIAKLLNINVQSVATFKYRLKHRLNLEKNQSLLEFIINF